MRALVTIPGKLPSINDYVAACRADAHVGARFVKTWVDMVKDVAVLQRAPRFTVPVEVEVDYYEPDRRRDIPNVEAFGAKVIPDALIAAGVIVDDGQRWLPRFRQEVHLDRGNPRIEVRIHDADLSTGR